MKQSRKMAKAASNPVPPTTVVTEKKPLSPLQQDLLAIAFLFVVVIGLHSQIFLNKQIYDGGDSHEAIVKTAMINKYYEQTGEIPRWNPYPEGGIPNVFFLPKPLFSPDFYIGKLGDIIGIPIVYLLIGAIGMYFLLRFLRFNIFLCVVVALCFVLAPYYRSLIIVGQYMPTKFEAVMIIPWMMLFFLAFIERLKLLHLLLFSFFFALQLLTQHYQVIYYTGLLLLAVGIYPLYITLREKNYKSFFVITGSLLGAFVLSLLLTAYPLFVSKKYNDASIRATWGIDISKPATEIQKGSGVSIDFINQWSPAARELTDLFIPAASGGSTKEKYSGNSAPELSGSELPAYWGKMTFSFSYLYFGLAVLLALAGLIYYRKNALVLSLGIAGIILTLWSLGTTLSGFYMFFYKFLPFFKNFRTPPTSMTVVFFIASLLSAYGLKFLLDETAKQSKLHRKHVFITLAAFLAIGLVFFIAGDSHSYVKTGENYEANYSSLLQKARKELYLDDVRRYFLLVVLLIAIIAGYLFRLFKYKVAIALTGILLVTDLTLINARYTNELMSGEEMYRKYMPSKQLADFFRADKDIYRVFPTSDRGRDLSAVIPIIGDLDLQVLTTVYEINTNNLYTNIDSILNINWNVLKIFGVKYFATDRELFHPQLVLKYSNPASMDYVYQFNGFTSFGHFVKGDTVVPAPYDRLKAINSAAFDPTETAMLDKKLPFELSGDSTSNIVTKFTPNEINYDVYTGKQGLFVLPVPYVKDGWSIFVDDKKVNDVVLANHAMQAVVVPAGKHSVKAKFNSSSYTSSYWISAIAWILFYLSVAFLWWQRVSRKARKA